MIDVPPYHQIFDRPIKTFPPLRWLAKKKKRKQQQKTTNIEIKKNLQ